MANKANINFWVKNKDFAKKLYK